MRVNAAKDTRREPPAPSGWLSAFIADNDRRRLIIAFAIAIAVHEILAGIVPWHTQTIPQVVSERITIAKLTRIEHRPRPTPKPKPTPKPIVHAKVIAPTHVTPHIVNPGKPSQHHKIRRIASARPLVHTRHYRPPRIHVPVGGHGAGTSTTAKAETGGVGPGGVGTGESGTGTGTGGAPAAHEPCGYVDFEPIQEARVDQPTGRVWEYVSIVVHFPDGTVQSLPLDYAFYYPSEAQDPFIRGHNNIPATFQFPPTNQRANEPPLVQYVIDHTTSDGYTLLKECPKNPGT